MSVTAILSAALLLCVGRMRAVCRRRDISISASHAFHEPNTTTCTLNNKRSTSTFYSGCGYGVCHGGAERNPVACDQQHPVPCTAVRCIFRRCATMGPLCHGWPPSVALCGYSGHYSTCNAVPYAMESMPLQSEMKPCMYHVSKPSLTNSGGGKSRPAHGDPTRNCTKIYILIFLNEEIFEALREIAADGWLQPARGAGIGQAAKIVQHLPGNDFLLIVRVAK